MSVCRSCGAPIRWVTMDTGSRNPIDPEPSDRGNLDIADPQRAKIVNRAEAEQRRAAGDELYLSHFASCPHAGRHRRRS